MQSKFRVANAAGVIERAGEGVGFCLMPGRKLSDLTVRPGAYPVRVKFNNGKTVEVCGPHAFYCDPSEFRTSRDSQFRIEQCDPGASWNVITFDDASEGVRPGTPQRLITRLQSATAVQTTVPSGSDGWEVRHGTQSWTAYATGTLQVARLWQRDVDGNWYDTLEDLDFSLSPIITRLVDCPGRFALRAAAATMNLRIEVTEEVA